MDWNLFLCAWTDVLRVGEFCVCTGRFRASISLVFVVYLLPVFRLETLCFVLEGLWFCWTVVWRVSWFVGSFRLSVCLHGVGMSDGDGVVRASAPGWLWATHQ